MIRLKPPLLFYNMLNPQQVKDRIPHTWPLFFTRHGQFTAVQLQAIPPILAGKDTLVIAATATGKTEAVMAPLLERHWQPLHQPGLSILYICPTRALVRDLYERLQPVLADSGMSLSMKTGDTGPVSASQPPAFLITTPESTDALLTRAPRLFVNVQAIVLDEIHLFDNTPRGDHMRCLLPRIERIRQYAQPDVAAAQRVVLSATVSDAAGVARRYLHDGMVVQMPEKRRIEAEIRPLYDLTELTNTLAERASHKTLLFCNSREEVENTAVYLRQHLPYHADIFVHYSTLDANVRRDVEERFAAAAVAICVSTSTLELGVDIGTVEDVVLLGVPHDLTAFLQRIGRGGRRSEQVKVLCLPKSPNEWARFEALLGLGRGEWEVARGKWQGASGERGIEDVVKYGFRPSVLVQQIFSMMKQSPTGSVRLDDVRRIAPQSVTRDDIQQIVSELTFDGYLQAGRPGEWKPDVKLQELLDRHDIYSNIGTELLAGTAVDAYSGAVLGQTNRVYKKGTVLLFRGRMMKVLWQENFRFGLAPTREQDADEVLRIRKSFAPVPFVVTQAVARSMGLAPGNMVVLPMEEGMRLYHFWGTVWGEMLTAVLRAHGLVAEHLNEFCLAVKPSIIQLPEWDEGIGGEVERKTAVSLSGRMEMGRYARLLPATVAVAATARLLNLERFSAYYQTAVLRSGEGMVEQLHMLADEIG